MLRGLKVTMLVFGATLVIEGILDIAVPEQRAAGLGLKDCAPAARLAMVILGASWLAAGSGILLAARNPLGHLSWVKFAFAFPLVLGLSLAVSALRGDVPFGQVAIDIIFNALFVGLFALFFPGRTANRGAPLEQRRPPDEL